MALSVKAEPEVGSILCEVFLALNGSRQGLLFLPNHLPLSLLQVSYINGFLIFETSVLFLLKDDL